MPLTEDATPVGRSSSDRFDVDERGVDFADAVLDYWESRTALMWVRAVCVHGAGGLHTGIQEEHRMDISNAVSREYVAFSHDTPVSKVTGVFEDPTVKGVVVREGEEFVGIITRRQLATSHRQPTEKIGSLVWHVPRLDPDEDVREVAQLMIDCDAKLLPVFDDGQLAGVVTADELLATVHPFLGAATVREAFTSDVVTAAPDSTFGKALHEMREHRIAHLPVVDSDRAVGILSLHDVANRSVRAARQSQGGSGPGFDAHGGAGSAGEFRSHGGFGAREGEQVRLLDLPVRDIMVSPVRTIHPEQTLEEALEEMFEIDGSSLVVVSDEDEPLGIVTKTDVLRSLTWEAGGNRAVQVIGTDLLDDVDYEDLVAMVDRFDGLDGDMTVLDAKIHLHEHDEKLRGTPLVLARMRLYTDRGFFLASGEGYGASHAIHEARDVLERQIRDGKTYGRSKKHPDETYWEKRWGWLTA